MDPRPIGIFDSGIGGLSILREIENLMPAEDIIYFADQAHVPYGQRTLEQIRLYSNGITQFLLDAGCKLIVVACNTASAAALHHLRAAFPRVLFVGMEPAVKPAVEATRSGVIGVLATPVTFEGELFASVVARFAANVRVLQETPLGLVELIENGDLESAETRRILEVAVAPFLQQEADTIVLGCTHYPFIIPLLRRIAGAGVRIIDPAPAISRQVMRLLKENNQLAPAEGSSRRTFYSSSDPNILKQQVETLHISPGEALPARWSGHLLTIAE